MASTCKDVEDLSSSPSFRPKHKMNASSNNNFGDSELDHVSETSSMEDRRFEALLGDDNKYGNHAFSEGDLGEVHAVMNTGHRLYITGCAKEREKENRLQHTRERILLQELTQVTTKPSITNYARWKPAKGDMFAEHSEVWAQQRDMKLALKAEEVREEREKELQDGPVICPRSIDIVEANQYKGPVTGWHEHYAKYFARKTLGTTPYSANSSFSPNINRHYPTRDRNGNISDRLFLESFSREERLRELENAVRETELYDPYTYRPYFTPQIVKNTETEERGPVWDRLYSLRNERSKHSDPMNEIQKTDIKIKFNNNIDISRRRPLYDEDKIRELQRKNKSPDGSSAPETIIHNDKKSKNTLSECKRGGNFLQRNENAKIIRQKRLNIARQAVAEYEIKECTFRPTVNRRSMELVYHSRLSAELNSGTDYSNYQMTVKAFTPDLARQKGTDRALSASSVPASSAHSPINSSVMQIQQNANASLGDCAQSFERQISAVLDEWRRLEDV